MRRNLILFLLLAGAHIAGAWTNGQLLIWMDADRAGAMQQVADKFEHDYGIPVRIETPEKITDNFPLAAQAGKGPDIVIWAHDKVGEWAEGGVIAPIEVTDAYKQQFYPMAWDAVRHRRQLWGYPISFEAIGMIYNKKLVDGAPPTQLSELIPFHQKLKSEHAGMNSILWDYSSPYYSWGVMASGGGYIFGKTADEYDPRNVGVATDGAVEALSEIVHLIDVGVLPRMASSGDIPQELMAQGKLAMMISGPWDWPNLIKCGIDFGVAPMPGVNGKVGKAFIGVQVAYINRSSPNRDLAKEFLEKYAFTKESLCAMDHVKPIGIPAMISLYDELSQSNPLLGEMKRCADQGEVMPNIPQMGKFWTATATALQVATSGRASPAAALADAQRNMLKGVPQEGGRR
ncbi:MAG TPA: maltose/maltodextrin ABC transporter substrate-binding protein MalE [Chthoniobacterales bacterium]|nr:maltose/maltodextrin ABC transporter substrate-binding protein MalE [Chthoniobacterales bacterium]